MVQRTKWVNIKMEENLVFEKIYYDVLSDGTVHLTGSAFTNHTQEHSLSFFLKICKLECNMTSDWLNQSEVVFHSNASIYRKIEE